MSFQTNNDNIYPIGTVITAKKDPTTKLVIQKYYHRAYYCSVVGDENANQRLYFEKDLIAPGNKSK